MFSALNSVYSLTKQKAPVDFAELFRSFNVMKLKYFTYCTALQNTFLHCWKQFVIE
ncbi:hypothetical protein MBOVPG45_0709 [Mycoplasmopsis bovis PG45]|uniref:Uncharacterized protein n=1 Tax=Mycoplasmopsis bovis (strain ATCC 25523 / DSM 22781 / NCTC 10131 / PG45) TaxID=289397 RepID=A0A454APA8_MYCBG|nr:hypothetical protein MBOVPG45_0709 [Mycoplasmopsis bovis PG45]